MQTLFNQMRIGTAQLAAIIAEWSNLVASLDSKCSQSASNLMNSEEKLKLAIAALKRISLRDDVAGEDARYTLWEIEHVVNINIGDNVTYPDWTGQKTKFSTVSEIRFDDDNKRQYILANGRQLDDQSFANNVKVERHE